MCSSDLPDQPTPVANPLSRLWRWVLPEPTTASSTTPPAPNAPPHPPPDFSLDEVQRRILASQPIPPTWRPFVTELDFTGEKAFSDLTALSSLPALHSLGLMNTGVTDLTPLSSLPALQSLDLQDTKVTDLAPLSSLPNLRSLDLTNLPPGLESALPRRAEIKITRS